MWSKFYYHGNEMKFLMKFYSIIHFHYHYLESLTKRTICTMEKGISIWWTSRCLRSFCEAFGSWNLKCYIYSVLENKWNESLTWRITMDIDRSNKWKMKSWYLESNPLVHFVPHLFSLFFKLFRLPDVVFIIKIKYL